MSKPGVIVDVDLAAYLIAKGFNQITRPEFQDGCIKFIFEESLEISAETEKFFNKETSVDALTICENLPVLKAIVQELRRIDQSLKCPHHFYFPPGTPGIENESAGKLIEMQFIPERNVTQMKKCVARGHSKCNVPSVFSCRT